MIRRKKKATRKKMARRPTLDKPKVLEKTITIRRKVTFELPPGFAQAELPKVLTFGDYHDIEHFRTTVERIVPGIKARELGAAGESYYAIFYIKKDAGYKVMCKDTQNKIDSICQDIYNGQ